MVRSLVLLLLWAASAQGRDYLIESGDAAGLVAAIIRANENPGPDRIFLSPGAHYVFDAPAQGHPTLALPPISGPLDLVGNKATLRRYADQPFAFLEIAESGTLRLVAITLADGGEGAINNFGQLLLWQVILEDNSGSLVHAALGNFGAALVRDSEIRFNTFSSGSRFGGAVVNHGHLELTRTRLYGNHAHGGPRGATGVVEMGAALSNFGVARLDNVTVRDNQVLFGQPGSGALANFFPGRLEVRDSTLQGNTPATLADVSARGLSHYVNTRFQH